MYANNTSPTLPIQVGDFLCSLKDAKLHREKLSEIGDFIAESNGLDGIGKRYRFLGRILEKGEVSNARNIDKGTRQIELTLAMRSDSIDPI